MQIGDNTRIRLQSCGRNDLLSCSVHPMRWRRGSLRECFQLNGEGIHMPAFSFEKISPPANSVPNTPTEKKQRGVIVQILDRFTERRAKRSLKSDRVVEPKPKPNS